MIDIIHIDFFVVGPTAKRYQCLLFSWAYLDPRQQFSTDDRDPTLSL